MNNTPTQKNTNHTQDYSHGVKNRVLNHIETKNVVPTSKMWWQCQECLVWFLWLGSIALGMIATAVIIFTSVHAGYALYEATHETAWSFFVDVLPYVWLVVFGVMAVLAYINIRNTKRGYRYPLWQILGSSILFSVVGGVALHVVGIGYMVDHRLGELSSMYYSQEELEEKMWHLPDAGRLVGVLLDQPEDQTLVTLKTISGETWMLETVDLHEADLQILRSGSQVRVLGVLTDVTEYTMHGCGVFPWMFDADVSLEDMQEDRKSFIARMYSHKDNAVAREVGLEDEVFGEKAMGVCADMDVVRRIEESM